GEVAGFYATLQRLIHEGGASSGGGELCRDEAGQVTLEVLAVDEPSGSVRLGPQLAEMLAREQPGCKQRALPAELRGDLATHRPGPEAKVRRTWGTDDPGELRAVFQWTV